jgi:diguanylate cyclase (GGDEF)-like protein
LRQLGHFLTEHTRGGDIVCRYGGEEFILILPEATLEQTQSRAEELRVAWSTISLLPNSRPVGSITLSCGVAAYPEHGQTAHNIIRAADTALYRAKQEGRNRVVVAR